MRSFYILLVFLFLFSCENPPKNVNDLLLANLEATGGKKNWEKLSSIKTEAQSATFINKQQVAKVKVIQSIQLPHLQREETLTNNILSVLMINSAEKGFYFKFEGEKPVGFTEMEPVDIDIKRELEILEEAVNFIFEEAIWEDQEVLKLINTETKEEYIYNPKTYFLLAHISETPYGLSTTFYNDYQEREGYFFAFDKVTKVPSASYEVTTSFSNIQVNPQLEPSTFQIKEGWIILKEGNPLPEFQTPLFEQDSQLISNSDLTGKVVLLDLWATWCKPCIAEFPNIKDQYLKYKEKGFEVVSISLDENEIALKQFLEKNHLPWINGWEKDGFKSKLAKDLQLASIPKSILIGRNGKILTMDTGATGEKLNQRLAALFE